jgi:hypothetical protein
MWPDALLSGHAHLYQRFTRVVNGRQVPYIASGSGGYAATPPQQSAPPAGTTIGDHTLVVDPIIKFGYLTLTTDAKTLSISFRNAPRGGAVQQMDSVTLNLATGVIVGNTSGSKAGASPKTKPGMHATAAKTHGKKR